MSEDEMTNGELTRTLVRIERKLDEVTSDHEKRLRTVERWMWTAAGTGLVGAAAGLSALLNGG